LQVFAIEKDRTLAGALRQDNLHVIAGDALLVDWPPVAKVVGNIPYYITSPLIDKALTPPLPERVVFLVQAEVADRLAAKPGSKTYGALSVGVQSVARVEKLFDVAAGAFRPPPKVQSTVVRLTPSTEPLVRSQEVAAFRVFVTGCFSRRRKQLRNVLPDLDLVGLGVDPTIRPERLSVAVFVRLFHGTPV
jgi:16S rRNA (adenine1518-N6/adenine1519-N6)-dimethyltransferase